MNTFSGILFFVAFLPYIWAIVNHQIQPSPVTWAIWACVDTLALAGMRKEKAICGQITGAVAGAWMITLLTLYYGMPSLDVIEWVCIAGAVAGIVLWYRTGNAVFPIIFSQASIFVGAIPTFIKAYRYPSKEDPIAWSIWFASCVCALIAVKKWDLSNALQPINFTVIETIMVVLVVILPLTR